MPTLLARVTQLLLLVGLGGLAAHWFWKFSGPAAHALVAVPVNDPARLLAAIQGARLFAVSPAPVQSSASRDIVLRGVYAPSGKGRGYALFVIDGRTQVSARPGEEVQPGLRLERIGRDHAMLADGARRQRIELETRRRSDAAPALKR